MKLANLTQITDIVNDNTIIIIRNTNFHMLTVGNWYQDNILEYNDREIITFTWQNDNKLYIDIAQGEIHMTIKGAQTIAEYKEIQKNRIQKWIDDHFFKGSVTWEMSGASHIKITDKTGDSMTISLDEIE